MHRIDECERNVCTNSVSRMVEKKLGRIIAIDYGLKRVGLAVTDPAQIIAMPLTALPMHLLPIFLKDYVAKEPVASFVVGMPYGLDGLASQMSRIVEGMVGRLKKAFPQQNFYYQDERFTSKLAAQALYQAGCKKKYRHHKENLDQMSATILLQSFLRSLDQGGMASIAFPWSGG